jgi:hypothetical protein
VLTSPASQQRLAVTISCADFSRRLQRLVVSSAVLISLFTYNGWLSLRLC